VDAGKLAGQDEIGLHVGKVVNQYKIAKHFELAIGDNTFNVERAFRSLKTIDLKVRPIHSFSTLMAELATIVRNTCRTPKAGPDTPTFEILTTPNAKQQRALDLIAQIHL